MKILVTGSSGHLGEALVRTFRQEENEVVGLDIKRGPMTDHLGSIAVRELVRKHMGGVRRVLHAATLHKPHVGTHSRQDFIDTNVTGTLNLLEEAASAGVESFVFTSSTSVFGDALTPPPGAPAAWITEQVMPIPKNIYGATKAAAEDLCQLFQRNHGLPTMVLRVSRFFPEEDDNPVVRAAYSADNLKVNEYLHRRAELSDIVEAHRLAAAAAPQLGFRRYIVSATTPFRPEHCLEIRDNAPPVVARLVPGYEAEYARRNWMMFRGIDRIYVNDRAREELGWRPQFDFAHLITRLQANQDINSPLARLIGSKGYHAEKFTQGPYPTA